MKTAGRLDGTRSMRWLGTALVLGAALAALPATPAPPEEKKAPASAGKVASIEDCIDHLVFFTPAKSKDIRISEMEKRADRFTSDGSSRLFCFENHSGCDVTISFDEHSPFGEKVIKIKEGEVPTRLTFNKAVHPDSSGKSVYTYSWSPKRCGEKGPKGSTAGAQMIVKP